MPTAREALLDAARAALADLPWAAVRMVDVAAAAGVSRQTLYNEFGSKEGLARALLRSEADTYLEGVERLLGGNTDPAMGMGAGAGADTRAGVRQDAGDRLALVAEWIVREARTRPLLRALLTGCWGDRLPAPRPRPGPARRVLTGSAAQRRADAGAPGPAELVTAVRERYLAALGREGCGEEVCELAVRLALSCVVAPGPQEEVGALVRRVVGGVSATSPRAGAR
ncbi:TetR/AcrR family transcriptional regulator [Streptomyces sp. NRRL S-118]|uniref:TetR/AcrR family transcriptional regulator n=1 Tax=Streptomyces sp. NRRL S-118 TaxID=1463881 RepID=UPI0004CB761B|nr:TetR/AcrR family transcriptional regulator [Streptomyces sp. NRRL S-118]